ncbi:beta/gamma crystallin-related protein, partial [Vibrio lentus]
ALGMVNDDISSLRIRGDYTVRIYEHGDFSGWSKEFTEDTPWVGDVENDKTSSIKVMTTGVLSPVALYKHGDFGGYEVPLFEGEYTQSEL